MITDLYIKHPGDPGYDENNIIEEDELSMLLAQIKMVLLTRKESVLGSHTFGVDEESYLFEFEENVDTSAIQNDIFFQLKKHCTLLVNRNWTVDVKMVPSEMDPYKQSIHAIIGIDNNINFIIAYE
jgi:hypothetical protein